MSRSSPIYKDEYSPTFQKQLEKLRRKAQVRAKRIEEAIQTVLADPYVNIDFGKVIYRGKREYKVGNDTIFFVACKQCRELGHQTYNSCSDCADTPNETVRFAVIVESHNY